MEQSRQCGVADNSWAAVGQQQRSQLWRTSGGCGRILSSSLLPDIVIAGDCNSSARSTRRSQAELLQLNVHTTPAKHTTFAPSALLPHCTCTAAGQGFNNTDQVYYITALNSGSCSDNIIAYTIICHMEPFTYRPNVAAINLCPKFWALSEPAANKQVSALVHEMIHGLVSWGVPAVVVVQQQQQQHSRHYIAMSRTFCC
jgi:endonuclease/exonuclease/phosphatase (EEP) superfamily protein YafD